MKKETVKRTKKDGMDAKEVALCVQTASQFESAIQLSNGARTMNAKSLMGMITLCTAGGDEWTVSCEGPDEAEALQSMIKFLKR